MSWLEWQGEKWPDTKNMARLHGHLWLPDAACPRRSWSLSLQHHDFSTDPATDKKRTRWVSFDIGELAFHESDWRRLEGLAIRSDAAWHEALEHTHEYGRVITGNITASEGPHQKDADRWSGHDYLLRFGKRDGLSFACELDAWLLRDHEFYRLQPETTEELARFGEGPPNLRVMAQACITSVTVHVSRRAGGGAPVEVARRYLREEMGLDRLYEWGIEWALRKLPGVKEYQRMEGWACTVQFRDQPRPAPQA